MSTKFEKRWNEIFELYKEYVTTHYKFPGAYLVYKEENLGQWFRNQIAFYQKGKLANDRAEAMNAFNPVWNKDLDARRAEEKRLLLSSDWKNKVPENDVPIDEVFSGEQVYACLSNGIYSCCDYLTFFEKTFGENFRLDNHQTQNSYGNIFSVENRRNVFNTVFPKLDFDVANMIYSVYNHSFYKCNIHSEGLNPYVYYQDFNFSDFFEMYNAVCPSNKDFVDNINEILDTLSPKHADILLKTYIYNKSTTEIGNEYGCSYKNIIQHLRKTERRLRQPFLAKKINVFRYNEPVTIAGEEFYNFKEPEYYPEVIKALLKAKIFTPKQLNETPAEDLKRVLDSKDYELLVLNLKDLDNLNERYIETVNNPEPPKPEEISIEDLNLSVRSYNVLIRGRIRTIGELSLMSEEKLMMLRNMGRKSYEEIVNKMHSRGYVDFPKTKEQEISNERLVITKNYRPAGYTFTTSLEDKINNAKNRHNDSDNFRETKSKEDFTK